MASRKKDIGDLFVPLVRYKSRPLLLFFSVICKEVMRSVIMEVFSTFCDLFKVFTVSCVSGYVFLGAK